LRGASPPPDVPTDAPPLATTTTAAEEAYLALVERVLATGARKANRTGVDTISSFAEHYAVDLAEGYPLLTTKTVYFGSMLREVLWYLSGADHIRDLRRHTGIWDAWADDDGNLQTAYGRFWRRFPLPADGAALGGEVWAGAGHPHVRREADGSLSFDQLGYVADTLRANPTSRRLVVSAWHPANAAVSLLPPCHYTFCFNVTPAADGGADLLNCHLTQRSADLALGVPFNLACYALLTEALAQWAGLRPGRFAHTLIDAHVYVNHIDGLREQLARTPAPAPRLAIARHADGAPKALDDLAFEDITLLGYAPQAPIRFEVAV
jgi:thymidylate synthase